MSGSIMALSLRSVREQAIGEPYNKCKRDVDPDGHRWLPYRRGSQWRTRRLREPAMEARDATTGCETTNACCSRMWSELVPRPPVWSRARTDAGVVSVDTGVQPSVETGSRRDSVATAADGHQIWPTAVRGARWDGECGRWPGRSRARSRPSDAVLVVPDP